MSARQAQPAPERCACGALPCLHKHQAGHTFLHYVSCTKCGVQTPKHDRVEDAVFDWNEGHVQPPQEDLQPVGRASARAAKSFNPVLP